jgi:uncharacterized metal-binding protein YceD (DUF177 family)
MAEPEFSRMVDSHKIDPKPLHIGANKAECAALAKRFAIVAINRLEADVVLTADRDAVEVTGTLEAEIVQSCAVSGEDFPVAIHEPLSFRFVPERPLVPGEEEIELEEAELDEIPFLGRSFDLGEAIAQSLALAIDPYATGPNAEQARKQAGLLDEGAAGPFAALAALKDEKKG